MAEIVTVADTHGWKRVSASTPPEGELVEFVIQEPGLSTSALPSGRGTYTAADGWKRMDGTSIPASEDVAFWRPLRGL
jgi:hypothetical protein